MRLLPESGKGTMRSVWVKRTASWVLALSIAAGCAFAQEPAAQAPPANPPTQDIPDAPSATKPAPSNPFPGAGATNPATTPAAAGGEAPLTPPPPSKVTTAPPGRAAAEESGSGSDEAYVLRRNVNFVVVPVSVKDTSGRLVEGLTRHDFAIYEDGVEQPISFFTSDPFPLSVAVVIDSGMSDLAMRKVNESLPNLAGAFSQFDEVSIYTYGNTVHRELDFNAANERLSQTIKKIRRPGQTGGAPVTSGPMASGPSVNGHPYDPSTVHVNTYRRESHVLNDAILQAALDLSARDQKRRKIIFVISDGREQGSNASYSDVLKVLLGHEIAVYGVAVDSAAVEPFSTLEKIHVPTQGYGNLLPKYANATAGQIYQEFSREAIEAAYAAVTEEARNQYTIGYTTHATVAGNYRSIEVRVHRGGLRVFAKEGYYPLPPARQQQQPQ